MGSWNETCGVTNLPILQGEKVRLLMLGRRGRVSFGNYQDDYWSPLMIPVRGRYDDYGNISKVATGVAEDLSRSFLRKLLVEDDSLQEVSVQDFWLHCPGKLGATDNNSKKHSEHIYHPFMVHEFAYQEMMKIMACQLDEYDNPQKLNLEQKLEEAFTELLRLAKSSATESTAMAEVLLKHACYSSVIGRFFSGWAEGYPKSFYSMNPLGQYFEQFIELAKAGSAELPQLQQEMKEFILFYLAMGHLRREFSPVSFSGSQSENYEDHIRILSAAKKHAEKLAKKRT